MPSSKKRMSVALLVSMVFFFRFQCLPSFLAQCQQKGLMDSGKVDQILSNRKQTNDLFDTSIKSDRNPVGNVLNAGKFFPCLFYFLSHFDQVDYF